MTPTYVEISCENGHRQLIGVEGMNQECVEMFAGLLDGSSPSYLYPPGEDSPIGKCGICCAKVRSTILWFECPKKG